MITAASAAALKLGLKAKQMDVVMGIVSEHDVLIKRCGKSLLWHRYGRLPYTYDDEALFIFSITSSRYRVATANCNGDSVAISAHV